MPEENVYKSKQEALFEAWLQDGIYFKKNDLHNVLSKQEAKNRIIEFVKEKEYSSVKVISDQLESPTDLTDKKIAKSLRVSFQKYAELVELALKQKTNLSTITRNIVVNDLEKILGVAKKRANIKVQRLNLFEKIFEEWKTETSKSEQGAQDGYSPSMVYYPHMSKELIKLILEKAIKEIEEQCSNIPSKVLAEYLKVNWKKNIDELHEFYADCFWENITLDQTGQLVLDIGFSGFLTLNMNLEEYTSLNRETRKQYGDEILETIKRVLDIDEQWADEIGELPIYSRLGLLSIPIKIKQGVLSIYDLILKDKDSGKEIQGQLIGNYEKSLAILRKRLNKAVKQEDWKMVSLVSDRIAQTEKDLRLIKYCLEIAFRLFHKKHVISFRAPEIVIRAWEAYSESKLEHLNLEA